MSVNPLEDNAPKVVRPNPGAALSDSHPTGRSCSRTLNTCSSRPPVKAIAPAVTPPENRVETLLFIVCELSATLRSADCAPVIRAKQQNANTVIVRMILWNGIDANGSGRNLSRHVNDISSVRNATP
jgi:hypothetical protein